MSAHDGWLVYGANGYTGELVAREAARRGLRPLLAGRREEPVARLAAELDLPHRIFALDDSAALARGLGGVRTVLHCAGPFVRTSRAMVEACLAGGVHYLDITGEIAVFESIYRRHAKAQGAGVALLPGAGFDVVPTDCLAARLAAALPGAERLELAFASDGGSASRGTLKTMIESLPHAGAIRRDGEIVPVPPAWDVKKIHFSCGPRWAMTIPWGDVASAFRTTGIPSIRVYTGAPPSAIRRMRRLRRLLPIAGLAPVKRFLQWRIERTVTGPDRETRESARVYLWGRAEGPGGAVTATLETPEGYAFTAVSSVECARRVTAGELAPGAWTPATAFGATFVEELDGVVAHPVTAADDTR
ncbi:MAG: saccharopine dehydrogenase NADP-binding domain-containing protein [Thermoanaerobaculia bacterium]|nr:saccharopine dehydrogenase NADP-binding domain-containing protein [Thermoanaerobaculia bacterium]